MQNALIYRGFFSGDSLKKIDADPSTRKVSRQKPFPRGFPRAANPFAHKRLGRLTRKPTSRERETGEVFSPI
jgi:hypothetical protein